MALIKCPECNKEISDHAETCPGCGRKPPPAKKGSAFWAWVLGIGILAIIANLRPDAIPPNAPTPVDAGAERRMTIAAAYGSVLKKNMREPNSVEWITIKSNTDASIVCFEYRARNGFGGMNMEKVVIIEDRPHQEDRIWVIACESKKMNYFDLAGARNIIR